MGEAIERHEYHVRHGFYVYDLKSIRRQQVAQHPGDEPLSRSQERRVIPLVATGARHGLNNIVGETVFLGRNVAPDDGYEVPEPLSGIVNRGQFDLKALETLAEPWVVDRI